MRRIFALVLALTLCGTLALAQESLDLPRRYSPRMLDSTPVVATDSLAGTTWAAWSYRTRGEFDIALSFRDADGEWTDPVFLGSRDRLDQTEPALVGDDRGNFYLAYVARQSGTIYVSALAAGRTEWFAPQQVTEPGQDVASPELRVVGDRLVLAYRSGKDVLITDWPLIENVSTRGIQEGPDGFPTAKDRHSGGREQLPGGQEERRNSGGFGPRGTGSGG